MSRRRDIFERLVQQTMRDVLFCETPSQFIRQKSTDTIPPVADSNIEDNASIKPVTGDINSSSLLHLLITSGNASSQDSADEDDDNNAPCRDSLLMGCANWSTERLRKEKAAIKRYLHSRRRDLAKDAKARPGASTEVSIIHEAYAILKLLLLEKDPDYRQCLQQSIGCTKSFLTSLHALLTLYSTYFERANGRQVRTLILPLNLENVLSPVNLMSDVYTADLRKGRRKACRYAL
ncbi:unnamed protein product [Phytophthora lilii]|uniref:Unnamed protein product n=1 Tax=Phytophthora lilii TaxID=2077276 RepID=A0A9W6U7U7_9STRA|nr:unnamed protein product [Phytophthora lilii]